jgi:hypothetical protein
VQQQECDAKQYQSDGLVHNGQQGRDLEKQCRDTQGNLQDGGV